MKKYIRPLILAIMLAIDLVPLVAMEGEVEQAALRLAEDAESTVGLVERTPKPVEPRLNQPRNVKLGDKIKGEPLTPYDPIKHKILLKEGDIVGIRSNHDIKYAKIVGNGIDHEVQIAEKVRIPVSKFNSAEMYILEEQSDLTAKKLRYALEKKEAAEKSLQNAMKLEGKEATNTAIVKLRIEIRNVAHVKEEASDTLLQEVTRAQEAAETKLAEAQQRLKSRLPEEEESAVQDELKKAQQAVNLAKAKQAQITIQKNVDQLTADFERAKLKVNGLVHGYGPQNPITKEIKAAIKAARKNVDAAKRELDAATIELKKANQAVKKATRG